MQSINTRDAVRGGTQAHGVPLDATNDGGNSCCSRGRGSTAGWMPCAPCALLALLLSLTVLLLLPAIAASASATAHAAHGASALLSLLCSQARLRLPRRRHRPLVRRRRLLRGGSREKAPVRTAHA